MKDKDRIKENRRGFIKTLIPAGIGLGLGLNSQASTSKEKISVASSNPPAIPTHPLAQDYSIIYAVDNPHKFATAVSSLVRLPSGRLLATLGYFFHRLNRASLWATGYEGGSATMASDDNGRTWYKLFEGGTRLHLIQGKLYRFHIGRGNLAISVSEDEGTTWSPANLIFKGQFYNSVPQVVIRNNTLYWCLGMPNTEGQWNSYGSRTVAVAADLTRDICDPAAWRMSEPLTYPGTPPLLTRDLYGRHDHYLEGNVVDVGGLLRVYWRIRIDNQGTAGITAICDLEDDGTTLSYRFGQFHPLPGAQNEFSILHDKETGLYWLFSNLVMRTQDQEWNRLAEKNYWFKTTLGGHERRILTLHMSFDALNWLPAAYLVILPQMHQAVNYVRALIDGNDLIFASRTCINGPNSHDADMVTFHRLHNFRDLSKPLIPKMPG